MKLSELVSFRKERLFQGAVQIGWYDSDPQRAQEAASCFVFHGPEYHGVSQEDVQDARDHKLTDTVTFTKNLLAALSAGNKQETPFLLAIAGYGTGKSHLGLTLATLLSNPMSSASRSILENIKTADKTIAVDIEHTLSSASVPFLVVVLNGMEDFDLSARVNQVILHRLKQHDIDTTPLEDLRPRFKAAEKFLRKNYQLRRKEFAMLFGDKTTEEEISAKLAIFDEETFKAVSRIFEEATGSPIRDIGHESLQELIRTVANNYCGNGKPFRGILIIFDEFGRYLEFAVERPHIAGSAALQQLFEGVQENAANVFLLCFIQHELKTYISRVGQTSRDELNRYIGRYDSAQKAYLSTNLETLFASLIEKKNSSKIRQHALIAETEKEAGMLLRNWKRWFPGWENHRLWSTAERFGKVVQEGCWPLHPTATWFLYRLASIGKSLQQRSAVSFLDEALKRFADSKIPDKGSWFLHANDLCTDTLVAELTAAEKFGQQGAIAHAYLATCTKYEHDLKPEEDKVLRSVLISARIGLRVDNQQEAQEALGVLSGQSPIVITRSINRLVREFGVLEWDDRLKRFDILGDAVPRSAFLAFLDGRVKDVSGDQRADLFAMHGQKWCEELQSVEPPFAQEHRITTKEWLFQATCSSSKLLKRQLEQAVEEWASAVDVETPRGHLIYSYLGPDEDYATVSRAAENTLRSCLVKAELLVETVPVIVAFLYDSKAVLGNALAKYWVLHKSESDPEAQKFRNFIPDYREEAIQEIRDEVSRLLRERKFVFISKKEIPERRLQKMASFLFEQLYPKAVPFPFDGFGTARGNAAKDCRTITIELINGKLNHDWVQAQPPQMQNRAITLLHSEGWGAFGPNGEVRRLPSNTTVKAIFSKLDEKMAAERGINVGREIWNLCASPYGCNLASSGVLLGLYVAGRVDKLTFSYAGQDIRPGTWVSQAYGNALYINPEVLLKTIIKLTTKQETDAWERLLAAWDVEPTHKGSIQFSEQAKALRQTLSIPGYLFDRWQLLEHKADESREAIKKWDVRVATQEEFTERAYSRKDAGNLSRCAGEYIKLKTEMDQHGEAWTKEQVDYILNQIENCKQATLQFFDQWLAGQDVMEPNQIGDFKDRMNWTRRNLEVLGLTEQAQHIETRTNKILTDMERRIRLRHIAEEAKAFIKANPLSGQMGVAYINHFINQAKNIEETLVAAYREVGVPELTKLREHIEELRSEAIALVQRHKERAGRLLDAPITCHEDIRTLLREVHALATIFDGCPTDLEDFMVLRKWLEQFDRDLNQLMNLSLPENIYEEILVKMTQETQDSVTEEDQIPWDLVEIYESFDKWAKRAREEAANAWFSQNLPGKQVISKMDARAVNNLRVNLQNPPPVLSKEQVKKVDAAVATCMERLDSLEVEGLLARFQALSSQAKEEFLRRAKALLG